MSFFKDSTRPIGWYLLTDTDLGNWLWVNSFWKQFILYYFSIDELIDEETLKLTRKVSNFYFPETGYPNADNIMEGYLDLYGDTEYNAIGSITARRMAEKVNYVTSCL